MKKILTITIIALMGSFWCNYKQYQTNKDLAPFKDAVKGLVYAFMEEAGSEPTIVSDEELIEAMKEVHHLFLALPYGPIEDK